MTSANTYVRMTSPGRVLELSGFCIVFSPIRPRALMREVLTSAGWSFEWRRGERVGEDKLNHRGLLDRKSARVV